MNDLRYVLESEELHHLHWSNFLCGPWGSVFAHHYKAFKLFPNRIGGDIGERLGNCALGVLESLPILGYGFLGLEIIARKLILIQDQAEWKSRELKSLWHASREIQDDKKTILEAIDEDPDAIRQASFRIRNDKTVLLKAIKKDGGVLLGLNGTCWGHDFIAERILKDREIAVTALKSYKGSNWEGMFRLFPMSLRTDKDFLLEILQSPNKEGMLDYLKSYLPDTLLKDRKFVKQTAALTGSLKLAAYFRDDEDIILTAIQKEAFTFLSAPKRLKDLRDFIYRALDVNGEAYKYLAEEFQKEEGIILAALAKKPELLFKKWYNQMGRQQEIPDIKYRISFLARVIAEVPQVLAHIPKSFMTVDFLLPPIQKLACRKEAYTVLMGVDPVLYQAIKRKFPYTPPKYPQDDIHTHFA